MERGILQVLPIAYDVRRQEWFDTTASAMRHFGDRRDEALYWKDGAKVRAQSPCTFAHRMDTPTLITHGNNDYRVPDTNGLAYYNTLLARGIPTRLVWFPDENHWVLKPRNSRLWYNEVFGWLAAHRV